jgi:hypothetical protein
VESAVEEMSATMDANIADRQKMLFSDVKTSAADPKQQRTPTSILKRGTKTDVGNVVTPPASVPPEMVRISDEKPFQRPPGAQPGHPASRRSSATDANLDASHENKKTTRDGRKAKGDINLGLYDCPDDESDDLAFSGGVSDDDGNPLEAEAAAEPPPDRSGAGADARIASQDARRQPQDTGSLSNGRNNNVAMGSTGFGGGSSDDSSSDSSSGRP